MFVHSPSTTTTGPEAPVIDVESLAAHVRRVRADALLASQRETHKADRVFLERICDSVHDDFEEQQLRATCCGRLWLLMVRCLGRPEEFKNNLRFTDVADDDRPLLLPIAMNR